MGARPYDPTIGRFVAVDPVDGGSLNNYDYAGQDPINGYDLDGMAYRNDVGEDDIPSGLAVVQDSDNCAKGIQSACAQGGQYVSGGPGINWTKIAKTALRTAKSYGFSCAVNGGIGALAGGGAGGFAIGCAEGIVDVYAEKHWSPTVAAGLTVISVGRGSSKIFIETSFGKGYAKALGQALCAAAYPACK